MEMVTEMHTGLCRICIQNTGTVLLAEFIENIPIYKVIENIFGIVITNNKKFSESICENCCALLSTSNEFKQSITRAERMWKHFCVLMTKQEEHECEIVHQVKVEQIDPELGHFTKEEEKIISDDYYSNQSLDEPNITAKIEIFDIDVEKIISDDYCSNANTDESITKAKLQKQIYNCNTCGKPCTSAIHLHRHRRTHCKNKLGEVCEICNKSFTSQLYLKIHKRTHLPDAERKISCEMCDKTFRTKTAYQMHVKHHNGTKDVPCTLCEKLFYHRRDLTRHMRTLHLEIKNYSCKICHKKFSNSGNLYTHMRVHTGERPYECKYCGFKFNQSSPLNKHMVKHVQRGDPIKPLNQNIILKNTRDK